MKRIISFIFAVQLLFSGCLAEDGVSRDEWYSYAIEALSNGEYEEAQYCLDNLGDGYRNVRYFKTYVEVLQMLVSGEDTEDQFAVARTSIRAVSFNEKFTTELEENYLPSCEDLLRYINAREYENNGQIEKAVAIYEEIIILDTLERYINLTTGHVCSFASATCVEPRTCTICGKTEGEALGHDYAAATCTKPKFCRRCGAVDGKMLGHEWEPATYSAPETCRRCNETRGEKLKPTPTPKPSYKVGDTVTFGTYSQMSGGGSAPIEWRVLDVKNNEVLLLSEKILEAYYYNRLADNTTWADCSLRGWLNGDFYNSAFNNAEKQRIVEASITAETNPFSSYAVAGNNTRDRVFILSINEVNKYLTSNYDRVAFGTYHAVGKLYSGDFGASWWWLRTSGKSNKRAARVLSSGEVEYEGTFVNSESGGVRPAIWITIE